MNIVINAWLLRKKELDGIGEFIKETMSRVIKNHPEVQFHVLCDKNFTEDYFDFPNAQKHFVFPALRHPVLYVLYMELMLPSLLKKLKTDLFIGPEGILSLRSKAKQLACIHDLNFLHFPENLNFRNRVYYTYFTKRFVKKAKRILTVSQYSKADIVKSYNTDPDLVDVAYLGVKSKIKKISVEEIKKTRDKYAQGAPYFFFVGTLHPRKNIVRLMEAFNLFKEQSGSDVKLILAGSIMWEGTEIKNSYETLSHKESILFAGRVNDDELNNLYCAALALTFVPVFEGFGLPIIEAFSAGTPVICSNVTSMPEVAGDAALLVDPFNVNAIKNAMIRISEEAQLRDDLIEKGNARKQLFSWDSTADVLWESVLKAIK